VLQQYLTPAITPVDSSIMVSTLKLNFPEPERLAALRSLDILDTAPEPELDELVQLAAAICEVPIALVTLLDERRQWFKASFGMDIRETPRQVAFCNHTIRQSNLLQVADATLDHRFADNPLVTQDLQLRFYAGIPIASPDGFPLGALCVLDVVPRQLSDLQAQTLRILGHQVNARLQLRAQRISLGLALDATRQANERLQQLATTDSLTGLANRHSLNDRFAAEFSRARRKNLPLSVLMLDVDNFKSLNDRYGHDIGDATLKDVAHLLRSVARKSDMVVRYGGEEFLALLPDTTEAAAAQFASRLLAAIHAHPWPRCPVTLSIGSASLNNTTPSKERLVSCADEALYFAKRSGKDQLMCYGNYSSHLLGKEDAPSIAPPIGTQPE
jgi:diguanylate cyclase (GGDEF)-like protein